MSQRSSIIKWHIPVWLYALCVIVAAVFIWILAQITMEVIVQYKGHKAIATVTALPRQCSRFNSNIKVVLDNREYTLRVKAADCRVDRYKIGRQLEVLRHPAFKRILKADDRPDRALLFYIAFLAAWIFYIRHVVRKAKKAELEKAIQQEARLQRRKRK